MENIYHLGAETATTAQRIAIIGAGWSGLAAAVHAVQLSAQIKQPIQIDIYEMSHYLGGRARALTDRNLEFQHPLDNGQHLLLGAYHECLAVMRRIGLDPEKLLLRQPMRISSPHQEFHLQLPQLPAPLHAAWGLLKSKGLTLNEKWTVLLFIQALKAKQWLVPDDMSVAELLGEQSALLIRALWRPLCLAALNTHMHEASAQLFVNVLRDALGQSRSDSDFLIPSCDLSHLFPTHAGSWLKEQGVNIYLGQRVISLATSSPANNCAITVLMDKIKAEYETVIIATPPKQAAQLIDSFRASSSSTHSSSTHSSSTPSTNTIAQKVLADLTTLCLNLNSFEYRPIFTVYLKLNQAFSLNGPINLLWDDEQQGHYGQWIFDRHQCFQAETKASGELAVIISSNGIYEQLDNSTLVSALTVQLKHAFPALPPVVAYQVIREKRATFAALKQLIRPANRTPLSSLFLCGDYTDTGYPATLEGAMISAKHAAQAALKISSTARSKGTLLECQ